jgi:hypothetical protein
LLDSPRSPDDCRRALEAETGIFFGKPILRSPIRRGDLVVLHVRHWWLSNAFETLAVVALHPGGDGTRMDITFRSQYFVAAFISFWLTAVVLIIGLGTLLSTNAQPQGLVVLPLFLFFGMGFIALGRLLARPDRAALLEFIARVTDGQSSPEALSPPR